MNRTAPPHVIIWLGACFAVWASALIVLYAVHALGCAFVWPAVPLRLGLGAVILVHLALLAAMWQHLAARFDGANDNDNDTLSFLLAASLWATIAAVVAVVFTLGPALFLTVCA